MDIAITVLHVGVMLTQKEHINMTITPREYIDAMLQGEKETEPLAEEYFSEDSDNTKYACAIGCARYAFGYYFEGLPVVDVASVRNAEAVVEETYRDVYGDGICTDNDTNLGREKTIQRVKDLYSRFEG